MLLLFAPLFLTGCKTEIMKSPEKLLDKPISDSFNHKIYTEIRKLTPIDTTFILPKNSDGIGRITITDLNNDGRSQVLAFKKKINDEQNVGSIYMYVFENNGNNIIDDSENMVRLSGDNLKSVNIVDLKNDGSKQVIVHVSNREFENIYVYEYNKHSIKKIADYSTSNYSIRLNFARYSSNNKLCFALLQDKKKYDVTLSKMTLKEDRINFERYNSIKNVDGVDKVEFINGKISENVYGTIMVYQSFPGNVISLPIAYKNNKFEPVVDENNINIKNVMFMKPQDINNDGILNIPKVEFRFTNNTPKESDVISWYQWNGSKNLKLTSQYYYCYNYNFKLMIPKILQNHFFIHQYFNDKKSAFYFYQRGHEDKKTLLFKINVVQRISEDVESKTFKNKPEKVIFESDNYHYLYEPIDNDILEKYNINISTLRKMLTFINK